MDAELFVQEATGQVVDQDGAVAGAWKDEKKGEEKKSWNKTIVGEEVRSRG